MKKITNPLYLLTLLSLLKFPFTKMTHILMEPFLLTSARKAFLTSRNAPILNPCSLAR